MKRATPILLVLMVTGALAVHQATSPDAEMRVSDGHIAPSDPPAGALQPAWADAPTEEPPGNAPARADLPPTAAVETEVTVQPRQWRLRGRLEFEPDLWVDPRAMRQWDRLEVDVQVGHKTDDDFVIGAEWAELGDNFEFDTSIEDSDMLALLETGAADCMWQVAFDSDMAVELLDYLRDEVPLEAVSGIVTPRISDGLVDFGVVTLGNKAVFGRNTVATGRLIHSSGLPLGNARGIVLVLDGDQRIETDIHTDRKGRFVAVFDDQPAEESGHYRHCFYTSSDSFYRIAAGEVMPGDSGAMKAVPAPSLNGIRLDYGEVILGGALLQVSADIPDCAPLTRPGGELDVNFDGDYDGQFVEFWIARDREGVETRVYPDHVTSIWLPEGRYFYEANMERTGLCFPRLSGVVNCPDGSVNKLVLRCHASRTIPLDLITPTGQAESAIILWDARTRDETVACGRMDACSPFVAPVIEGAVTSLRIQVSGYAEARAEAQPTKERLVVRLKREGEEGAALLRVHVTSTPPITHEGERRFDVVVTMPGTESEPLSRLVDGAMFIFVLPEAGFWRVQVVAERDWGRSRDLGAPLDVTLLPGQEHDAYIEADTALLYEDFVSAITCAGRECEGWLHTLAGNERWALSVDTGESVQPPALPVTILDGDALIAVNAARPEKAGQPTLLVHDLEVRAELRVTRRSQPVDGYTLSIAGPYARAYTTRQLWLPEGESTLTVSMDQCSVTRTVEIARGELQIIVIELEAALLTLNVPENESYEAASDTTLPPLWFLQAQDGTWMDDIFRSETFWLKPAVYRLVPGFGSEVRPIEVDLTSGEDRSLDLPELPEFALAEVKLVCDPALFGLANIEVEAQVCFAGRSRGPSDTSACEAYDAACVPDGLIIGRLPADTLLVLTCRIWGTHQWLTRPLCVRLKPGLQTFEAQPQRPAALHEDWPGGIDVYTTSLVPGVLLHFADHALPGTHELVVFTDGKEVARVWVTVAAGEVEFPPALADTLRAQGVIE